MFPSSLFEVEYARMRDVQDLAETGEYGDNVGPARKLARLSDLVGLGGGSTFSKTEADGLYAPKTGSTEYATPFDVALGLAAKAEVGHTHSGLYQPWGDYLVAADIAGKADAATVYTKTQVDTALSGKVDTAGVTAALATKSDVTHTHTGVYQPVGSYLVASDLNNYVDLTTLEFGLSMKAPISGSTEYATQTAMATKANSADVTSALALKANQSDVVTLQDTVNGHTTSITNNTSALTTKADVTTTYTKTQVDSLLSPLLLFKEYALSRLNWTTVYNDIQKAVWLRASDLSALANNANVLTWNAPPGTGLPGGTAGITGTGVYPVFLAPTVTNPYACVSFTGTAQNQGYLAMNNESLISIPNLTKGKTFFLVFRMVTAFNNIGMFGYSYFSGNASYFGNYTSGSFRANGTTALSQIWSVSNIDYNHTVLSGPAGSASTTAFTVAATRFDPVTNYFTSLTYCIGANPRTSIQKVANTYTPVDHLAKIFRMFLVDGVIGGGSQTTTAAFHIAEAVYIPTALSDADFYGTWNVLKTQYGLES